MVCLLTTLFSLRNVRFGSLAHHIDGGIGLFSGTFPETHVPIETRP